MLHMNSNPNLNDGWLLFDENVGILKTGIQNAVIIFTPYAYRWDVIHTRASAHRFKKFHARVIGVGIDFPFFHSHKGQSTFGVSDSRNFTYLSDWKKADHTMELRLFWIRIHVFLAHVFSQDFILDLHYLLWNLTKNIVKRQLSESVLLNLRKKVPNHCPRKID